MLVVKDSIDLLKSSLSFTCFKKGKYDDKEYIVHVMPDEVIFTRVTNQVNVERQIIKDNYRLPIKLSSHIKWEVEEYLEHDVKRNTLIGFKF